MKTKLYRGEKFFPSLITLSFFDRVKVLLGMRVYLGVFIINPDKHDNDLYNL